jgi:hypothetical protein
MEAILLLMFGCVFLLVSNRLRNEEHNKIYDKSKVKYTDGDNT